MTFGRPKLPPGARPAERQANAPQKHAARAVAPRAGPAIQITRLQSRRDGRPWIIIPLAKGGSAKSTTVANLAVLAVHAGLRVLILDTDQQGSTSVWAGLRAKHGGAKRVDVQHCVRGDAADYLMKALGRYDLVLIDTPPNLNEQTARLVGLSHLVLVTAAPHLFDVAEAMRLTKWLNARRIRPLLVLANTPADRLGQPAPIVAETRCAFEGWRQQRPDGPAPLTFGLWSGHVSRRLAVAHALTRGQGVMEFEPTNQAADDFRRLWAHIGAVLERTP